MSLLAWGPWLLGLAALATLAVAVAAFRGRRPVAGSVALLGGCLWLACATTLGLLAAGLAGYRAFTTEDLAARVLVDPTGPARFTAEFHFPDGRVATYDLAGDQLYVDARILKWHGLGTLLGLHTLYELDRVGGRYLALDDERAKPRTLYALGAPKPYDLFRWARARTLLAPFVDAEYGSATFLEVRAPAVFEVRVTTSGLVVRETS